MGVRIEDVDEGKLEELTGKVENTVTGRCSLRLGAKLGLRSSEDRVMGVRMMA